MTPLSEIPINSYCWLLGLVTLIVLGIKSFVGYRKSRGELTKYMIWFSVIYAFSLTAFAVPSVFTLDPDVLRKGYLVGEFFFFAGMITQASILWCLVLRRYFSIYLATVPVAVLALATWMYDVPRSKLWLGHSFINYVDPLISRWVIVVMMTGLFVPVGVYLITSATKQAGIKATVTSLMLGIMYSGIGLSCASQELITHQIVSPSSSIINIIISAMLFVALVLPWNLGYKPLIQDSRPLASGTH